MGPGGATTCGACHANSGWESAMVSPLGVLKVSSVTHGGTIRGPMRRMLSDVPSAERAVARQ